MNTEKKHLLLISDDDAFVINMEEGLSLHFEIKTVHSLHSGYHMAIHLLPDIVLIDQTSHPIERLKNLSNFKSTHFLNKCWLLIYASESSRGPIERSIKTLVDEVIYSSVSPSSLCGKIIQRVYANSTLTNYWKDSFMGLFNLLANPVVLLQNDTIVSMNDAFRETFKTGKRETIKITDFLACENKTKLRESLRNFARGKHMKAVTKTALQLKNNKIRNAKVSFAKLDTSSNGQYILMIHFMEEEQLAEESLGSNSPAINHILEQKSQYEDFSFTKREKEIIQLLCKGYKTKDISEILFISPKTIEKHRANIIRRTNSETILESIIYAINHNLIDLHA